MEAIIALLQKIIALLEKMNMVEESNQDKLYKAAFSSLGKDISPEDIAADELGCVESLTSVITQVIPFPKLISTITLDEKLRNDSRWKQVAIPNHGDVVNYVTGSGNGSVKNGHCGIVGKNASEDGSRWVMTNDSRTGKWEVNYTVNSMQRYFASKGGMMAHYYRLL